MNTLKQSVLSQYLNCSTITVILHDQRTLCLFNKTGHAISVQIICSHTMKGHACTCLIPVDFPSLVTLDAQIDEVLLQYKT